MQILRVTYVVSLQQLYFTISRSKIDFQTPCNCDAFVPSALKPSCSGDVVLRYVRDALGRVVLRDTDAVLCPSQDMWFSGRLALSPSKMATVEGLGTCLHARALHHRPPLPPTPTQNYACRDNAHVVAVLCGLPRMIAGPSSFRCFGDCFAFVFVLPYTT